MNSHDADIVIAGGGPAGLSTALHLHAYAPALRIIVLERERYPRDKICAGAIAARAFALLRDIDVRFPETPSLSVDAFELEIGGGKVQVREPASAIVVRRIAFDAALMEVARARGIEVREAARVCGVRRESNGIVVTIEGGTMLSTRVLVGADGVSGAVRRLAGFERGRQRAQAIEVDTERTTNDAPPDTISFRFSPELRGYFWDFPTPLHGRVMMSRGVYQLRDDRSADVDVRAHLATHLHRHGLSLADHEPRRFAEQGLAPHSPLATSRILLVGEAAGIDFPTGEGIAQAIAYGAVAGPYLAQRLAADRLGFGDWAEAWFDSAEGRFLRTRHRAGQLLFGTHRPRIERALLQSPTALSLALRRFAGRPLGREKKIRAAFELARGLFSSV